MSGYSLRNKRKRNSKIERKQDDNEDPDTLPDEDMQPKKENKVDHQNQDGC